MKPYALILAMLCSINFGCDHGPDHTSSSSPISSQSRDDLVSLLRQYADHADRWEAYYVNNPQLASAWRAKAEAFRRSAVIVEQQPEHRPPGEGPPTIDLTLPPAPKATPPAFPPG